MKGEGALFLAFGEVVEDEEGAGGDSVEGQLITPGNLPADGLPAVTVPESKFIFMVRHYEVSIVPREIFNPAYFSCMAKIDEQLFSPTTPR